MIIATAGHVDHGKTSLIKALTGTDTDRLPDEKARGLSIDLGFAYQALANEKCLGFVDVPGHERFIRNMLAGVGGIDLGLLVIAADDGVMPQTREHFSILNLLGIRNCIVAITKIDLVTNERVSQVRKQVDALVGEERSEKMTIYPLCTLNGVGVEPLAQDLNKQALLHSARSDEGYFRMAIDRVFTLKGVGLVVTGMVLSGKAMLDDTLVLSKGGKPVRVRSIRAHNVVSDSASAGQRCAINISGRGISKEHAGRGCWLMHQNLYMPTRRIDVDLQVLETEARALKHWTPTHLHIGADHLNARVAVLSGGSIAAGDQGMAQLVLEQDAFVAHGDHFVLRDQSANRTIAGGHVIDPFSPKRGRARPTRITTLQAMNRPCPSLVLYKLASQSERGVLLWPFTIAYNLPQASLENLVAEHSLKRVGSQKTLRVFSDNNWQKLLDQVVQVVSQFHQNNAESIGPSHAEIQQLMKPYIELELLIEATTCLVEQGCLGQKRSRLQLPTHRVTISAQEKKLLVQAMPYLAPNTGSPLSLHQAAQELTIDVIVLESALIKAVKMGEMFRVGKNRYLPRAYLYSLVSAAEKLAGQSTEETFTVVDYCQQTKLGRNFAINLLEYFDKLGLTRRCDNSRRINRSAVKVFSKNEQVSCR